MEEIITFILRIVFLLSIMGMLWVAITQVVIPLIFNMPIFPLIKSQRGNTLTDIREWQEKRLREELEDRKKELELTKLEADLQAARDKIDKEKARSAGDKG